MIKHVVNKIVNAIGNYKPLLAVLPIMCFIYTACTGDGTGDKKQVVTVMVPAQVWIADQFVDTATTRVVCLMERGGDPETFEPDAEQMRLLAKSRILFTTGDTMGWESELVKRARANNAELIVINTAERIQPITHSHGDGHGDVDPHIWTSTRNLRLMAVTMAEPWKMYQRNVLEINKKLNGIIDHLDSLDNRLTDILAPVKGTSFVVWHPSMGYFARDYGLKQIAIDDGHEPSARRLAACLDSIRASGAKVILLQRGVDSRQALTVARELNLKTVYIDIMSADWEQELIKTANALAQ